MQAISRYYDHEASEKVVPKSQVLQVLVLHTLKRSKYAS
eukprot:SAG31_NODE_34986_length_327_cov_0.907895_1_plen_38_part_10